ncbi:DMT family transporter [Psychromonas sp. CD1]|uniref:DMT family transporter n=1 Tax=Psychromonas sp. CD1 TaxID=1979839 RepID=UPI002151C453|nr:EamA family transporter [Psychromonas sp. CD1]
MMNKKIITTLLFVSVCVIWGTTWMAMEMAVQSIPAITATGLRFLFSAPLLILLACKCKVPLFFPKDKKQEFILISLFYFAFPFTLMIYGEQYISSGLASLIFANMPVIMLVFSLFRHKQKIQFHQCLGLGVALVCLMMIISNEIGIKANGSIFGVIALFSAVLMHASIYSSVQNRCKGIHILTYNAVPCLVAGLLLVVGTILEQPQWQTFTLLSFGAVIYLGVIAGIGGIMAYFQLNKMASPFQASLCFLIFPVIALALDSLVNGRNISHDSYLLSVILLLGVFMCKLPLSTLNKIKIKCYSISFKKFP